MSLIELLQDEPCPGDALLSDLVRKALEDGEPKLDVIKAVRYSTGLDLLMANAYVKGVIEDAAREG